MDGWLARTAPYVALGMVALAFAGRLAGWPRWLPLAGLALSAVILASSAIRQKRSRPTSDAIAAAVDDDAALRGELREKGLARARQFSWETSVRRIREIYGQVLDQRA